MNSVNGKMEAGIVKVNGEPIGDQAYLSIGGVSIAHVFAGPFFGRDEDMREIALANARRLADLWNGHNEADKRDAARYRWLRKNRFFEWRDEDVLRCGISFANAVGPWEPDRFQGSQQKMDAAIDAAMRSPVSDERSSYE